jgi:hypothetical protein
MKILNELTQFLTLLFHYEGILPAYNRYKGVNRGMSNEQYREQRDGTWIFSVHLSFLHVKNP